MSNFKKILIPIFVAGLLNVDAAYLLPDTLWVKVALYDFHADGSNPNFEACGGGRKLGMIQDTLNIYRKPVLKSDLLCNDRLSEWYQPSGAPGSTFEYDPLKKIWSWSNLVPYKGRPGEWVGPQYDSTYDMASIVIYDSLPFTIFNAATGTYEFVRNKNLNTHEQFFWLDNRGFGNEPVGRGHNYSFSMELHHEFTYHGGEYFEFYGDDDAWAFVNGQMVLDLGGLQSEVHGKVSLDQVAGKLGLVKGKKYIFDFFYTERRTTQSNVVITTNLLTPSKPDQLVVFPDSNYSKNPEDTISGLQDTTVKAGECLRLYGYVVDDTGAVRRDWGNNINWEVLDSLGNKINLIQKNESNTFCFTEAFGWVNIYLSYQDSLFPGIILYDTVKVFVQPGIADHIVIEASADSSLSLRNDNPLTTLVLSSSETSGKIYAVLRDRFGNFVGYSTTPQWNSFAPDLATVNSGNISLGEGVVTRKAASGITSVTAVSGNFRDTVDVLLESITYNGLRIVSGAGLLLDLDTLRIRADQDTTLYALGRRSDNGQWDNVLVTWSSAGVAFQPQAPLWDNRWYQFSPISSGNGRIIVSRSGSSGFIADTVIVIASSGNPNTLVLYPKPGIPDLLNKPYSPPSITIGIIAGQNFPATAKIFDSRGNWLQNFETVNTPITWRIVELTGNGPTGSLSSSFGATISLYPVKAYNKIALIGEYRVNSVLLSDTVTLNVFPGSPDHMVIEGSPDRNISPNSDNPLQSLTFTSIDTNLSVYAVIRDSLGNFISFSQRTTWWSTDTGVATISSGNSVIGEGVISRDTISGKAYIIARNGDDSTLIDTLPVTLAAITYDSLRIVVNSAGLRDISTLAMKTGDDTLLYALGLRSDTRQWENVRVKWNSPGLLSVPSAPVSADRWMFTPASSADGSIIITYGSIADTVRVIVSDPDPVKLVLYPSTGSPGLANTPFKSPPAVDSVIAGNAINLSAKLFSVENIWLQKYENDSVSISWKIVNLSGSSLSSGNLQRNTGANNVFLPVIAHITVDIIASYTYKTQTMADTVRLFIKPAPVHHLVIESSPEWRISPDNDNPVDTVFFGYGDTVLYVYAVLRDVFGNFVMYSSDVAWQSKDTGIIAATRGIASLGEGRLIRKIGLGVTTIWATDKAGRVDSAFVRLTATRYDSLRIVSSDGKPISQLVMVSTNDTTLLVQGRNVENGAWEYVPADWSNKGTIVISPAAPSRSEQWAFTSQDTGSGFIITTFGSGTATLTNMITVKFIPGTPVSMVLYPKAGAPEFNNQPYPATGSPIIVQAGKFITIVAKLFDQNKIWLSGYELRTLPVKWTIIEQTGNSGTASLSDTTGFATILSTAKAHRIINIAAVYQFGISTLTDTIEVQVIPGPAHHLVIEANQNREISPNADNPLDSIVLTNKETYRRIYAVVRDAFGNYIDYSQITDWTTRDSLVVTVQNGIAGIGEGIISRIDTGSTWIKARNRESKYGSLVLLDSMKVIVSNSYYLQLRIVNMKNIPVDNLVMSTNNDTILVVQGLRSIDSTWETIQSEWEISSSLDRNIAPPQLSEQWRISPVLPASGWIRVTLGIDSITRPDTVFVSFTQGEPLSAQFQIITPLDMRIAGDTVVSVVKIYNSDGLVPGHYCFPVDSSNNGVVYYDSIGKSNRLDPDVIFDDLRSELLRDPEIAQMREQCFFNGVDTVKFVLYYAPYDKDSVHEINVNLDGISVSSGKFNLLPGRVNSVSIERIDGKPTTDTIFLHYPDDATVLAAIGYDRFGNKRGPEISTWSEDSTLHPIWKGAHTTRIYYESADVTGPETGNIFARSDDTLSGIYMDSVFVIIGGPIIKMLSAHTGDADGNGYLDRIVLIFSKPISLPHNLPGLSVIYDSTRFITNGLLSSNRSTIDSIWTVLINEDTLSGLPQTSWSPYLNFDDLEGVGGADNYLCKDGAGPVIWSVTKNINKPDDRTEDCIVVKFSESIRGAHGMLLDVSVPPAMLFNIWYVNSNGSFVKIDSLLGGIISSSLVTDDRIEFYVRNGVDISSKHFFNINSSAEKIMDNSFLMNLPVVENQRVRVVVNKAAFQKELVIYPNPSSPVFSRVGPGEFSADNNPAARDWVKNDRAGSVISCKITTPEEGKVSVIIKIYDAVGNLVNKARNDDFARKLPKGLEYYGVDFYWNGSNYSGMKVAPGVYRVLIYIDYTASNYADFRLVDFLGIGK